jgi:hypothetical protein
LASSISQDIDEVLRTDVAANWHSDGFVRVLEELAHNEANIEKNAELTRRGADGA